jgi:hypothetical protein
MNPLVADPVYMNSDKVTQLQDQLDVMSQIFFNSVGIAQRDAPPVPIGAAPHLSGEHAAFYSQINQWAADLVATTQQIDAIIESLPGGSTSEEEQLERIEMLKKQHGETVEQLKATIERSGFFFVCSCIAVIYFFLQFFYSIV